MAGNSRQIDSNQNGIHEDLERRVLRYREAPFRRPPAPHSRTAFAALKEVIDRTDRPLIVDSGCGTGRSTRLLAARYPEHLVIGIDKSLSRLSRENETALPDNAFLLRADLTDLYAMMAAAGIEAEHHFILYPNPWPKAAHLTRRWHASPVFPAMLALGGRIELRTNWEIYALEFAAALRLHGRQAAMAPLPPRAEPLTLFEKKYTDSGHALWQVVCDR